MRIFIKIYLRKKERKSLYSAIYTTHSLKVLKHDHTVTCKLHHACLSFISILQMASPLTEVADIQLQLTTRLSMWKDERLSWPGWLTYSGRFTNISGHPSATGRAQDRESSLAKDQRSATVTCLLTYFLLLSKNKNHDTTCFCHMMLC